MQAHPQALEARPQPGLAATWALYFQGTEYDPNDRRALLASELVQLLANDAGWQLLRHVQYQQQYVLHLDYEQLLGLCSNSADLVAALEMQPVEALNSINAAVHELLFNVHWERCKQLPCTAHGAGRVMTRLHNYPPSQLHIRQLKSSTIGRLATIRGTVVRMSHIRPLITQLDFSCNKCGVVAPAAFPDGRFVPPSKCPNGGCRSRAFTPDSSSAVCIDWKKIRIQELLGADQQQQGRVPRSVEVELKQDLASTCVVGDVVTVLGLVKVLATGEAAPGGGGKGGKGPKGNQQNLFLIYLDAVSVINVRKAQKEAEQREAQQAQEQHQQMTQELLQVSGVPPNMPDFTFKDLHFILKFTQEYEGDQLRVLSSALCPSIYGHELVKAGLLLSLLGGVRKNAASHNRVPIRGDIHVLLVGDPGLGKSQMLQAVAAAAPRGLYVCGNTSTGAGLTVSVVRDAVTGDSMFEAGAVVLADRGVCCVDEFDKIPQEHQALLEAMEQQEVSVAKAGLVASLPARTAVVAAANPVGGRYDRGKTLQENLKLSPAMLSRFDLTFVLLDKPDEALDQALSEHVLAMHSGMTERAAAARQRLLHHQHTQATSSCGLGLSQAPSLPGCSSGGQGLLGLDYGGCSQGGFGATQGQGGMDGGGRVPLAFRLKVMGQDETQGQPPLPQQLLRKYIAYASSHVFPVLSDEAKAALQGFYLQLRADTTPAGGTAVTARQLESLVRLAEARARCELREVVTQADAEDAIEIMKESLFDRCPTGLGLIDFRQQPVTRKGKGAESQRYLEALRRLGQREGRDIFQTQELQDLAVELNIHGQDPTKLIDQLNAAGELLKKGPATYRVTGVRLDGNGNGAASSRPFSRAASPAASSQR